MNTLFDQDTIKHLVLTVIDKSVSSDTSEPFRLEYAMHNLGRILSDLNRVEVWRADVAKWITDDRVLKDAAPVLQDYVKR